DKLLKQKQSQQPNANKTTRDTSQDLDVCQLPNYSRNRTKYQTKHNTCPKIFNFTKTHLRKFTSGQPIPTITGKEPTSKPP
ncbi:9724_t:CDS:1, partial [Gigaspora margarita]